jgi:hypothetical protein
MVIIGNCETSSQIFITTKKKLKCTILGRNCRKEIFRRTLINLTGYEGGESYAMSGFRLRMYLC